MKAPGTEKSATLRPAKKASVSTGSGPSAVALSRVALGTRSHDEVVERRDGRALHLSRGLDRLVEFVRDRRLQRADVAVPDTRRSQDARVDEQRIARLPFTDFVG